MHVSRRFLSFVITALVVGLPALCHAAAQVALHQVNTSAGLKQDGTVATKWKLQTDPSIDLATYVPLEGKLSNTYDPTKLQLVTSEGAYLIGTTVIGLGAYSVVGFDVLTTTGGHWDVQKFPNGAQTVTFYDSNGNVAAPSGSEAGTVFNIHFILTSYYDSLHGISNPNPVAPQPANQDQLFYEIELQATDGNDANDPGVGSTFAGLGDFLTVTPASDPYNTDKGITTGPADINASLTPEPASITLLGAGLLGLLARRRRV